MAAMKAPGVYIVEKDAFPNSIVEVATAVPAFIGYTERASFKGKGLAKKPVRITSLAEYVQYFGGPPKPKFEVTKATDPTKADISFDVDSDSPATYTIAHKGGKYLLYYSMKLFFQNGGGPCYIVSVGGYGDPVASDALMGGIAPLVREPEVTMVLIPETVLLDDVADAHSIHEAVLLHCGVKMQNRIGILDLSNGDHDRDPSADPVEVFRNGIGVNQLDYGTAYYPWVHTTIVGERDVGPGCFTEVNTLEGIIRGELGLGPAPKSGGAKTDEGGDEGEEKKDEEKEGGGSATATAATAKVAKQNAALAGLQKFFGSEAPKPPTDEAERAKFLAERDLVDKSLRAMSSHYVLLLREIRERLNLLPPGPAMAGIYTMVDATQGVWKAPANVSINSVSKPAVDITAEEQEDLNVTPQGKSINAIRTFIGEGVLVWGARTLDGNSLDWRYISVRRTVIMLEESVKLAAKAFVFGANDANTWVTIKSMIRNFLTGIWKQGGLAGATPEDAFSVHVGLGETMTAEDILEGILRVTVLIAVTRPAEFIEITFQQQMQKS